MKKLWGKRFEKAPSPRAEVFSSGRDVRGNPPADERLIPYDLWGSRAHVVMLARQKILPEREARLLVKGLKEIEEAWQRGKFPLDPSKEDVHTNVESYLIERYGMDVGEGSIPPAAATTRSPWICVSTSGTARSTSPLPSGRS